MIRDTCTVTTCSGNVNSCGDEYLCCVKAAEVCDEFVDIQADRSSEETAEANACAKQFEYSGACYDGKYKRQEFVSELSALDYDLGNPVSLPGGLMLYPITVEGLINDWNNSKIGEDLRAGASSGKGTAHSIVRRSTSLADCLRGCSSLNIQLPGWPGIVASTVHAACQAMCYVRW